MAVKTLQYLRSRFETGDIPNQTDFIDLIDSCYNGLTGDDASQILSYVTNFSYFNTFLSVLTSNSLYGTSNEYPVYTNTNLSLSADQINVNLNELEDLVKRSNTLLNTLTGGQSNAITRLSTLTGVDYASSSKQNTTNNLLNALTGQTNNIEENVGLIQGFTNSIRNSTSNIPDARDQITHSVQLSSGIICTNIHIWSIKGTSFAGYDQYLQIRDIYDDFLYFTQKIKANENFEFKFWPNGPGSITGSLFDAIVCNSLTPFSFTTGNNDLYLRVTGKSAYSNPGGPV
jgi:hypothetical protein